MAKQRFVTARMLIDARMPLGSGLGRYVRNIVPAVADRLPEVDFDLLVRTADVEKATAEMLPRRNLAIVGSAIRPFSISEQISLHRLAAAYDATWFTNYWMPLRWSGKFAVTVHDLIHLEHAYFPASMVKRGLSRWTFQKIKRDAAAVVFVSRFTQRVFEQKIGRPKRAVVIHHGIDHLTASDSRVARGPRMLLVAAAKQHKNIGIVLDAWERLNLLEGWQLTIVSPADDLRSSVPVLERALSMRGVEVVRGIADAELAGLMAQSSVTLVPSFYEGFGFPLLEGMVLGAQCISSTAAALVEIGSAGQVSFVSPDDGTGWINAMKQAVDRATGGTQDVAQIIAANRAVAAEFCWDAAADATTALLTDLLSKRSGETPPTPFSA